MADDIQQEEVSVEQLQQELEAVTNSWKRTLADFENYKKRKEAESKELLEFAKEVTVAKLLPSLDSLEQALRHMPKIIEHESWSAEHQRDFIKQYDNWQKGVNGIVLQLDKTLSELGVQKIEAIGKKFDPNFHEAVKEVVGEQDDGMVLDELQSGFILNGKVIRPSQVVISKKV